MAQDKQRESGGEPAAELRGIKNWLLLLAVGCFFVSSSVNVFLAVENWVLKTNLSQNIGDYKRQITYYQDMQQVAQRLVDDLKTVSREDDKVKGILTKYKFPLSNYKLDAITGATATKASPAEGSARAPKGD